MAQHPASQNPVAFKSDSTSGSRSLGEIGNETKSGIPLLRLPVEILQHIYHYLGPRDFNAARHTCSTWMRASLDKSILMRMLHRGGWSSSAGAYRESVRFASSGASNQSEEWLISRNLSRQCALTSNWTGNGLDSRPAIVESSQIDLTELAKEDSTTSSDQCGVLVFSTSECGRFMLAARDTLVYIYESKDGSLVPITTLVCPRQVLSMSMAASSGRGVVAMLLEGRLGMVCELGHSRESKHQRLARVVGETCLALQ
jgi:hypothetical protein